MNLGILYMKYRLLYLLIFSYNLSILGSELRSESKKLFVCGHRINSKVIKISNQDNTYKVNLEDGTTIYAGLYSVEDKISVYCVRKINGTKFETLSEDVFDQMAYAFNNQ